MAAIICTRHSTFARSRRRMEFKGHSTHNVSCASSLVSHIKSVLGINYSSAVHVNCLQYSVRMQSRVPWIQLLLVLLTTVVCRGSHGEEADNRTELHIAFITSFGGEFDSSVAVPAVQLAADKVNEDESLLPDHKLVVELIDDFTVAKTFANSKVRRFWVMLLISLCM